MKMHRSELENAKLHGTMADPGRAVAPIRIGKIWIPDRVAGMLISLSWWLKRIQRRLDYAWRPEPCPEMQACSPMLIIAGNDWHLLFSQEDIEFLRDIKIAL
jgi:hypothetical protein